MAKTTKAHREAVYAVMERGAFHAHFVNRRDDEKAHRTWLASGRAHEDSDLHDAEMMAAAMAEIEAAAYERGRMAEAERWARRVEEMAASAVSAAADLREDPMTSAMEACADQLDETAEKLRELVREMRGGGT